MLMLSRVVGRARGALIIAGLGTSIAASSSGCATDMDEESDVVVSEPAVLGEAEIHALSREAANGVRRIYQNEVEYILEATAEVETPAEMVEGVNTWVYDGKQVFSDLKKPAAAGQWEVPSVHVGYDGDPDEYFGVGRARKVDAYGRRWVLAEVDHAEVQKMVDEYDAEVRAQFPAGEPEEHRAPPETFEYSEEAGEIHILQPTSWDVTVCAEGSVIWNHDNDDLDPMPAPANEVARKVLWLGSGSCSGSMVDDEWLLTAAHCVTDSNGNAVNASTLLWCTMENLDENIQTGYRPECYDVVAGSIEVSPSWTGASDEAADYAVLKLDTSPGLFVGWIALASASDSYIDGFTDYTKGYQRKDYDCTDNTVTGSAVTDLRANGRHLFGANGDVQSTPSGYMKYNTSTALGISGGPHFYCPNGPCETGGHYLTGVQAYISVNTCSGGGTSCAGGFSSGPKATSIRTWVAAETP